MLENAELSEADRRLLEKIQNQANNE
jgi:hypothetical protein